MLLVDCVVTIADTTPVPALTTVDDNLFNDMFFPELVVNVYCRPFSERALKPWSAKEVPA